MRFQYGAISIEERRELEADLVKELEAELLNIFWEDPKDVDETTKHVDEYSYD